MKRLWSVADLLDLEFFLEQDDEAGMAAEELARRDRDIFLHMEQGGEDVSTDRSRLLAAWLIARRNAFIRENGPERILPGDFFRELIRIGGLGLFIFFLLAGWGSTLSYLSYSGRVPVNVTIFLSVFVGTQLLLLASLFLFSIVRLGAGGLSTPLSASLLRRLLLLLARRAARLTAVRSSFQDLGLLLAGMQRRKKIYGSLLGLPFFRLLQGAGIGFNLGVLSALLLKVSATDIAFGWQSSLQLGSETVHRLVQLIARPWSWLLPPPLGYPDLARIEGSRLILKDGIAALATTDLVSWWPFLCMTVAVYGLLPRLVLYFLGLWRERSLLKALDFRTAQQRQVVRRMLTPNLSTTPENRSPAGKEPVAAKPEPAAPASEEDDSGKTGVGQSATAKDTPVREPVVGAPEEEREEELLPPGEQATDHGIKNVFSQSQNGQPSREPTLVLIPDELFDDCPRQELAHLARERLGLVMDGFRCLDMDEMDIDLSAEVDRLDTLLLLQEAWQPPIEDFFYLLRRLREQVGEQVECVILLIGKPSGHTIFTPVRESDFRIWQQKINGLADPYLHCLSLMGNKESQRLDREAA